MMQSGVKFSPVFSLLAAKYLPMWWSNLPAVLDVRSIFTNSVIHNIEDMKKEIKQQLALEKVRNKSESEAVDNEVANDEEAMDDGRSEEADKESMDDPGEA